MSIDQKLFSLEKKKLVDLFHSNQYEEALSIAEKILYVNPNDISILEIKGKIHLNLGDIDQTINSFQKAISLNPNCEKNYNAIALSLSKIGKNEKAIQYLNKSHDINKKNPTTHFNLGVIFFNKKKWLKSAKYFNNAIKIKPYYPDAHYYLGRISYNNSNFEKALIYFKRCIQQKKDHDDSFHEMGNSLRNLGRLKDAIFYYKTALEINPERIDSNHCLGLTFYGLNQFDKGKKIFKDILMNNHFDYFAKRNIAIGQMNMGYIEDAINCLVEVIPNLPDCSTSLSCLLGLSAFEKKINSTKILNKLKKILQKKSENITQSSTKIVSLHGFGRSGSLFLHSLFDGHPSISTLPGYFFKGWFNEKTWSILQPNFEEDNWREKLVQNICNHFEPQFNANSKKNVIGRPNDYTDWFAQNLGFTQLGKDRSEVLELDQDKFKNHLIKLLKSHSTINIKVCFELIHEAFHDSFRKIRIKSSEDKTIFYHLHNPNYYERASFNYYYPQNKSLFIVRNPIQMLESWITYELNQIPQILEVNSSFENNYEIVKILQSSNKITHTLRYFLNPLNSMGIVRGVKLEDIKNDPQKSLDKICKWIGIKNDPSLYKSEFMGKKFSRPSVNFDNISGFDKKSIDVPVGRIFGERDITILETLFWPFMNDYKYTNMSKRDFINNIKIIRPWIEEPFEFEKDIHKKLPKDTPDLQEIGTYQSLHRYLIKIWEILNETKTYPYLIEPLE